MYLKTKPVEKGRERAPGVSGASGPVCLKLMSPGTVYLDELIHFLFT